MSPKPPGRLAAQAGQPSAQASDDATRRTLGRALFLIGPGVANVRVELASVPPAGATRGVEGWTTYSTSGKAEQVVVYTESEVFRCARRDRGEHQCLLRVASIIVHEVWHLTNGADEAGAYQAPTTFLILHGGSPAEISGVSVARDRFVAAQRKAIQIARGGENKR